MHCNEFDQTDKMAEEGDTLDIANYVDGEEEESGGDQSLDDHDMVTDMSDAQARTGKYRNYENIPLSGDAVYKRLYEQGVRFCTRTTYENKSCLDT
ncbi:hypothetical protein HanPI659440_Chr11g0434271 [Helianthus annuus]|nr:hypothetical protein HanPI659440_Chr11g0434271 [Helianthus annuus]